MLTAKVSTKGRIVLPQKLREVLHVRAGDTFEFVDGEDPDLIILRRINRLPNEGLVDALIACPHRFEIPTANRDVPAKPKL